MLKKVFVAAAIMIACPAIVFAQDIFFRFGGSLPEAGGAPPTRTFVTAPDTTSGSVFIYSRSGFNFREANLRFFSSNSDVAAITGGEVFNPTFNVVGGRRFSETEINILESNNGALNLSGISLSFGINQALGELFDPLYDPSLGPDGAFLLARIDYDVVGIGSSLFALTSNGSGVTDFSPEDEPVSLLPEFQNVAFSNLDPNVDPDEPFIPPSDIAFLFGGSLPEAGGGPVTNTFFSPVGTTGSVNIYTRSGFDFDAADIDFFSSNPNVVRFTNVEMFNPTFGIGGTRFDSTIGTTTPNGDSGNLFMVAVLQNGINQALGEMFDPLFDPSVGPDGSFLLARVDYAVVGIGEAQFAMGLGDQGIIELPDTALSPLFGNATFSSVPLPVLGDVNRDGVVSFFDIAPLIEILSAEGFSFEADVNQDGVVNFLDIAPFVVLLTSPV